MSTSSKRAALAAAGVLWLAAAYPTIVWGEAHSTDAFGIVPFLVWLGVGWLGVPRAFRSADIDRAQAAAKAARAVGMTGVVAAFVLTAVAENLNGLVVAGVVAMLAGLVGLRAEIVYGVFVACFAVSLRRWWNERRKGDALRWPDSKRWHHDEATGEFHRIVERVGDKVIIDRSCSYESAFIECRQARRDFNVILAFFVPLCVLFMWLGNNYPTSGNQIAAFIILFPVGGATLIAWGRYLRAKAAVPPEPRPISPRPPVERQPHSPTEAETLP